MCICFFRVSGTEESRDVKLVFCGNRDEFFSRASIPLRFQEDAKDVVCGRDAVRGGTWLGMRSLPAKNDYRFAVVHNFRHADKVDVNKASRGDLPLAFLTGEWSAKDYAEKVFREGEEYMGFTLVLADQAGVYFVSNRGSRHGGGMVRKLGPGNYALCNALLDTPWPKLVRGKKKFKKFVEEKKARGKYPPKSVVEEDELMDGLLTNVLCDNTFFPNHLPGTLDSHTETYLSSIYVEPYIWSDFGFYGTRMQTLVVVRADGTIRAKELTLDMDSPIKDWRGAWISTTVDTAWTRSRL